MAAYGWNKGKEDDTQEWRKHEKDLKHHKGKREIPQRGKP